MIRNRRRYSVLAVCSLVAVANVFGFSTSTLAASKQKKTTTKARKAPQKTTKAPLSAKGKAFPTPPGAGDTSAPVDVDPFVNPPSAASLASLLTKLYAAPAWFPLPDAVSSNMKNIQQNTISGVDVRQSIQGSSTRFAETFRTSVTVRYNLPPSTSPQQALDALRARPGYPNFVYEAGSETDDGIQSPHTFRSDDGSMSVFVRAILAQSGIVPRTSVSVTTEIDDISFQSHSGLIPLADWPQGIDWDDVGVNMALALRVQGKPVSHRGSHFIDAFVDYEESATMRETLSNPTSFTGSIKIAGRPEAEDDLWSIPIEWYGRVGSCFVRDEPPDASFSGFSRVYCSVPIGHR